MSKRQVGMCQYKTRSGNVFPDREAAEKVAIKQSIKKDLRIHPYQCAVCHKWHIGKIDKIMRHISKAQKRERMQMKEEFLKVHPRYAKGAN